ncbi:carboxypeptidase regulatory-like domain-containing protein [Candidatus Hydrogenedentota bacterium]
MSLLKHQSGPESGSYRRRANGSRLLSLERGIWLRFGVIVVVIALLLLLYAIQRPNEGPTDDMAISPVTSRSSVATSRDEISSPSDEPVSISSARKPPTRDLTKEGGVDLDPIPAKATEEGACVTGRVYDAATGEGLGDIVIAASLQAKDSASFASESTDTQGIYRIDELPEGLYSIERHPSPNLPVSTEYDHILIRIEKGVSVEGLDFPVERGMAVRGRVVDRNGLGAEGALVEAETAWRCSRTARANPDGSFILWGLMPTRNLFLRASGNDLRSAPEGPLTVSDRDLDGLLLTLAPPGAVKGLVLDPSGRPVTGITIAALFDYGVGLASEPPFDAAKAETNDEGRFFIEALPSGSYQLTVCSSGGAAFLAKPLESLWIRDGETTDVTLILNEARDLEISGKVADSEGAALPGIKISYHGIDNGAVKTGADGRYNITGLLPGRYRLMVLADPKFCFSNKGSVEAGSDGVDFVLNRGAALTGWVTREEDGSPVTSFEIMHWGSSWGAFVPWMSERFVHVYDSNGRFHLDGVDIMGGKATIVVRVEGYSVVTKVVSGLSPGECREDIRVIVNTGLRVEGVVCNELGNPLAGTLIYAGDFPGEHWAEDNFIAETRSNGTFAAVGIDPECRTISAWRPDYAPGCAAIEPGYDSSQALITLKPGAAIEGRVTRSGEPISRAMVYVEYPPEMHIAAAGTRTNHEGRYRIAGVAEGLVRVVASVVSGKGRKEKEVATVPGETIRADLDFEVASGSIAVSVLVDDREPPFAQVEIHCGTGEDAIQVRRLQKGRDGVFHAEDLPAGMAVLTIKAGTRPYTGVQTGKRYPIEIIEGEHLEIVKKIRLDEGAVVSGSIEGVWEDENALVLAFSREIELSEFTLDLFWKLQSDLVCSQVLTRADRGFKITGLDPGAYTLVVAANVKIGKPDAFTKARIATTVITVRQAEEHNIEFDLH